MPDVYRYSVDLLEDALKGLVQKGLSSVLIFGIVDDSDKDELGSAAGGLGKQSAVH